jgi:hypothetical protein
MTSPGFTIAAAVAAAVIVLAVAAASLRVGASDPPPVDLDTQLAHAVEDAAADPVCTSRFLDHHCTRTDAHTNSHRHHDRIWWDTSAADTPRSETTR